MNILVAWSFRQSIPVPPLDPPLSLFAFPTATQSIEIYVESPFGIPGIFIERAADNGPWEVIAAITAEDVGAPFLIGSYIDSDVLSNVGYTYRAQTYEGARRSVYIDTLTVFSSVTPQGITARIDDADPGLIIVEFPDPMNVISGIDVDLYSIWGNSIAGVSWGSSTTLEIQLAVPASAGDALGDFTYSPDLITVSGNDSIQFDPFGLLSGTYLGTFTCPIINNIVWVDGVGSTVKTFGTALADYGTLNEAFTAINDGTITGDIILHAIGSAALTGEADLNTSGVGLCSYTSILIYPTVAGISLVGVTVGSMINLGLQGSIDNFVLDGRVNRVGHTDLEIIQIGTGNAVNISGGTDCAIVHCSISGGVMSMVVANSMDSVKIISNDINNYLYQTQVGIMATTMLPSTGPLEVLFNRIQIVDCDINVMPFTAGIWMPSGENMLIRGNSLYAPFGGINGIYSGKYIGIYDMSTGDGGASVITKNFIGGTAPYCFGFPLTNADTVQASQTNNNFVGIFIDNGAGSLDALPTLVTENTIQNIDWNIFTDQALSEPECYWAGIQYGSNHVLKVGELWYCTNNLIGSKAGTGSVRITSHFQYASVRPIQVEALSGVVNFNTIGSFIVDNVLSTNPVQFQGILCTVSQVQLADNTVGGTALNSIDIASVSSDDDQTVYGIWMQGLASTNINRCTVRNITNRATYNNPASGGHTHGIRFGSGTVQNSTVYNISTYANNLGATLTASLIGISAAGPPNQNMNVLGCTVYGLANNHQDFAGTAIGIYMSGRENAMTVNGLQRNFVYGVTVPNALGASIYGIKIGGGSIKIANNIISLSPTTRSTVYGVYEANVGANKVIHLFYNTILLTGTLSAGIANQSYCFYSGNGTNIRAIKNNLLINRRSTAAGASLHYAIYFNYGPILFPQLFDYNNLIVTGTGGILGRWDNANVNVVPIIDGLDINDVSDPVTFRPLTGADAFRILTGFNPGDNAGTSITNDYASITRTNFAIGAFDGQLKLPLSFTASTNGVNTITLEWETSDPESNQFQIEIAEYDPFAPQPFVLLDTVATGIGLTQYVDAGATQGIIYTYRYIELSFAGLLGSYGSPIITAIDADPVQWSTTAGLGISGPEAQSILILAPYGFNADSIPDIAQFTIAGKTIDEISIADGTGELVIHVTVPFVDGDVIGDLVYVKPASDRLQYEIGTDRFEIDLASFTVQVDNINPVVSATVENAAPNDIVIVYGAALDDTPGNYPIAGDNHCFAFINGNFTLPLGISCLGDTVTYTMTDPIVNGDVVEISYQRGDNATDLKFLATGNTVGNHSNISVTNNVL